MEAKKEKNYLSMVILVLFVIFLILYISKEAGYYDYKAHNKAVLTKEAIEQFESDVESGKNVVIKDYLVDEYVDYSNLVTDLGYNTGNLIESFMNKGIRNTLKVFKTLFFD